MHTSFSKVVVSVVVFVIQTVFSNTICTQEMWVPNDGVFSIQADSEVVYIGGKFNHVGPYTGGCVPIDNGSGKVLLSTFSKIQGRVFAICVDSSGGWFVGGEFSTVDNVTCKNIAHILSDGRLDVTWNADVDGAINAIALKGNTLFIGGRFSTIDGQERNGLAALNTQSSVVVSWNPEVRFLTINAIVVINSVVCVAGTLIGSAVENQSVIASFDSDTGTLNGWNINANSTIVRLSSGGTTLYAGGEFSTIGGQNRNRIAAINSINGEVTEWNPNSNGRIIALATRGTTVYAGGTFTSIGGQSRNNIAAIDALSGLATDWNPVANQIVISIASNDSAIYVGGFFTNVGGKERSYLAALDPLTGNALDWNPSANNVVVSIMLRGSTVLAGGGFTSIGGRPRSRLAALNAKTGEALEWNPHANGSVNTMLLNGSRMYVAGSFDTIGAQYRNHLAAIDAVTGSITDWNPAANGSINAITTSGATVFVGGQFTQIGDVERQNIAAFDTTTGNVIDWKPVVDGFVKALATDGISLFVGGIFNSVNGQSRKNLAAIDIKTGQLTNWNPSADGEVTSLTVYNSNVFAAGAWTVNQLHTPYSTIPISTGIPGVLSQKIFGAPRAISYSAPYLFIGNSCLNPDIADQSQGAIVVYNTETGTLREWNLKADYQVDVLAVERTRVYVGGFFSTIGDYYGHPYFAQFRDVSLVSPIHRRTTAAKSLDDKVQFTIEYVTDNPVVRYTLDESLNVSIILYTLHGRVVAKLQDARQSSGNYSVAFRNLPQVRGIHVVEFSAGTTRLVKRVGL